MAIEWLVDKGADVNMTDDYKEDALCLAATNGRVNCIEILIQAGAEVNKSYGYYTSLMRASEIGSCECVELLLHAGADVNGSCEMYGDTALHRASS